MHIFNSLFFLKKKESHVTVGRQSCDLNQYSMLLSIVLKVKNIFLYLFIVILSYSCAGTGNENDKAGNEVTFVNKHNSNQIDIMAGGRLFASYRWPVNVYKPILYPVYASSGTIITRGFPLNPRSGERIDHMHQVGIWFTYGNVNGIDFWGNGYRGFKEPEGGEIKHVAVEKTEGGDGEGVLLTRESWIDPRGKELMKENTEYHFIAADSIRIIDRITTLTAGDTSVYFKDTKEGMFGIRVARQLELPSDELITITDSLGNSLKEKVSASIGATGNYHSSDGLHGEQVWGTRARWMALDGEIGAEKISLVICDHPENPGYPTYWHARGYGLFAANPFGLIDFTKGKEEFGFSIPVNQSVTFRYRVIIKSGSFLSDHEINDFTEQFSRKYGN